ncbi:hypothetical protein E4U55_006604 [Claviceps digitariae]|nr:hypothetical protein E4U55_006604 [Claviceps digitariae]
MAKLQVQPAQFSDQEFPSPPSTPIFPLQHCLSWQRHTGRRSTALLEDRKAYFERPCAPTRSHHPITLQGIWDSRSSGVTVE